MSSHCYVALITLPRCRNCLIMLIVTSLLIAINVSERDYSPLVKILHPDILKNTLGRIRVVKRVWVGKGSGYSSMPDQGRV